MLINAFRQELKDILSGSETDRMPVIRRSLLPDWLYATDFPALCRETEKKRFLERLEKYMGYLKENNFIIGCTMQCSDLKGYCGEAPVPDEITF